MGLTWQDPMGNTSACPLVTSPFGTTLPLCSAKEYGGRRKTKKHTQVALTLLIQISPGIWLELICISSHGLMRIRGMGMLPAKRRWEGPAWSLLSSPWALPYPTSPAHPHSGTKFPSVGERTWGANKAASSPS